MSEPVPAMRRVAVRLELANGRVWECVVLKPGRASMTLGDLPSFDPSLDLLPWAVHAGRSRRMVLEVEANPDDASHVIAWQDVTP